MHTSPCLSQFTVSLDHAPAMSYRMGRFFRKCAKFAKKSGASAVGIEHVAQALYVGIDKPSNLSVVLPLLVEFNRLFTDYPAKFFPAILLAALRYFRCDEPGKSCDVRTLEAATDMLGCSASAIVMLMQKASAIIYEHDGIVALLSDDETKVLIEDILTFTRLLSDVEQAGVSDMVTTAGLVAA